MNKSPLGKLTPELRNRIWELVLVRNWPIAVYAHVLDEVYRLRVARTGPKCQPFALTATCQQIHGDSTPMLYSLRIIFYTVWWP